MATNLPRRKFLHKLVGSAAGLAFFPQTTVFAIPNRHSAVTREFLSFTELEGLGPEINVEFIDGDYIALHAENALPSHMFDAYNRDYVEYLLREMVASHGLQWDETDRIIWTYQYYGYCDHSNYCNKLLDYSRSAYDFLYNTVEGLLDVNVDWSVLTDDFDFKKQTSTHFSGMIGRYTYLVNRVILQGADGKLKDFGLVNAAPVNRAINYITSKGHEPNTSLMYIIPGNTSLLSPFSEMLHLTTHGPSRRLKLQLVHKHYGQYADDVSHTVGETITESAAILTAQKFLKKHNLDKRMSVINKHAKFLDQQYALMGDTLSYMKLHGVQKTLNRFSDDPLHLVKEISHSFMNLKMSALRDKV